MEKPYLWKDFSLDVTSHLSEPEALGCLLFRLSLWNSPVSNRPTVAEVCVAEKLVTWVEVWSEAAQANPALRCPVLLQKTITVTSWPSVTALKLSIPPTTSSQWKRLKKKVSKSRAPDVIEAPRDITRPLCLQLIVQKSGMWSLPHAV